MQIGASIKKLKAMIGKSGKTCPGFTLSAGFIILAATIPNGRDIAKIIWHKEKTDMRLLRPFRLRLINCAFGFGGQVGPRNDGKSVNLPRRALPMAPAISQLARIKLIDNSLP